MAKSQKASFQRNELNQQVYAHIESSIANAQEVLRTVPAHRSQPCSEPYSPMQEAQVVQEGSKLWLGALLQNVWL